MEDIWQSISDACLDRDREKKRRRFSRDEPKRGTLRPFRFVTDRDGAKWVGELLFDGPVKSPGASASRRQK